MLKVAIGREKCLEKTNEKMTTKEMKSRKIMQQMSIVVKGLYLAKTIRSWRENKTNTMIRCH
jgi:hypothetical protein